MFSICDRELLRHSLPVGIFTVGIPINFFAEIFTITCKGKTIFVGSFGLGCCQGCLSRVHSVRKDYVLHVPSALLPHMVLGVKNCFCPFVLRFICYSARVLTGHSSLLCLLESLSCDILPSGGLYCLLSKYVCIEKKQLLSFLLLSVKSRK